jgi:hypothetical protein
VPLPADFDGWSSNTPVTVQAYTSNTSNGTIKVDVSDTSNTAVAGCAYAAATPGSTNTWTATGANCDLSTGSYTANGVLTLRLRLTGNSGNDVRIGDVVLSYKSKF